MKQIYFQLSKNGDFNSNYCGLVFPTHTEQNLFFASTLDQVLIDTTEYKLYLVLPQENMMSLYDVDTEVALGFKDFFTTKFVFLALNWQ